MFACIVQMMYLCNVHTEHKEYEYGKHDIQRKYSVDIFSIAVTYIMNQLDCAEI